MVADFDVVSQIHLPKDKAHSVLKKAHKAVGGAFTDDIGPSLLPRSLLAPLTPAQTSTSPPSPS